ncbi:CDC7-like protein kinase [Hamiltosporidium tvaerminnensis]|uniref:non-specific serine/threonine protein kinase n=1 Tax=Hamiltosporidium tvaerminnensis TaxID=1176355 RepID=A0A4Q9LVZ8_9MICR|nr:CDC7-like protein kinase [Hamiltosporidium tvaerminnensis]
MVVKITDEEIKQNEFLKNRYQILEHSGEGTFSTVYKAIDLKNSNIETNEVVYVALKNITKTSSPHRVSEEIKFLLSLNGNDNVVPLLSCLRHQDQITVVFPYFEFTDFREFLEKCTVLDIKYYMYNLLLSVKHVHSKNIIHRDIKPSNFLYNFDTKTGQLIDFGLAQYENPKYSKENALKEMTNTPKKKPTILFFGSMVSKYVKPPGYYVSDSRPQMKAQRAGTRGFRAPEVLFRSPCQSRSIDIWSVGVIFLILLTKQYPFFNSSDDIDAILEIACIFGHNEMRKAAKHYERIWKSNINTCPTERITFEEIVAGLNPSCNLSAEGYDLLYRMLDLYSERRISADDALNHPFFNDIS